MCFGSRGHHTLLCDPDELGILGLCPCHCKGPLVTILQPECVWASALLREINPHSPPRSFSLIRDSKAMDNRGGTFAVANVPTLIQETFEMTGLSEIMLSE